MSTDTIGTRVRERREALGLSRAELVERASLSLSLIEKLEGSQGDRRTGTTASAALALADALDCDMRWLVSGEGKAPARPKRRKAAA